MIYYIIDRSDKLLKLIISLNSTSKTRCKRKIFNNRCLYFYVYISHSYFFQNDTCTVKRRPVKVFDIQHQASSSGNLSVSEMATSVDASSSDNVDKQQPNFNLVKLFMKQKSMSTEGECTD